MGQSIKIETFIHAFSISSSDIYIGRLFCCFPSYDRPRERFERKKKKLRSTLALLWMVSIQFLTKGNMLSLLPVAQKSTFLQNVEIMQ